MRILAVIGAGAIAIGLTGCAGGANISASCDASMETAAGVVDLDNNIELLNTTSECGSAEEWVEALKQHPSAGSLVSYTSEDAFYLLGLTCVEVPTSAVCADAKDTGQIE